MTPSSKEIFNRAELLLGADVMERLAQARVILFGVGGVGSWCAEGLIRSGIGHLTLVDADCVAPSNINRQRMATVDTVGLPKVDVLRDQLLSINPEADIRTIQARFTDDSAASFDLASYDYIIDAIDALKDKAALISDALGPAVRTNAETARNDITRAVFPFPNTVMQIPASIPRCIPESASTCAQPHCLAFS